MSSAKSKSSGSLSGPTPTSTTARSGIILEDVMIVHELERGAVAQKFQNVSRVEAKGNKIDVLMDVQSELYRLKTKERFTITLATTLDLSGKPDDGKWNPTNNEPTLLDKHDYGMYGKVFRVDALGSDKSIVYVSHGGLLMRITGENRYLAEIELDKRVYTLLKREAQ